MGVIMGDDADDDCDDDGCDTRGSADDDAGNLQADS